MKTRNHFILAGVALLLVMGLFWAGMNSLPVSCSEPKSAREIAVDWTKYGDPVTPNDWETIETDAIDWTKCGDPATCGESKSAREIAAKGDIFDQLIACNEPKSAREIAQKTFPSVVMVMMQDPHGQPSALGSGFFVKEDVVATNLHVVEGAAGGYVKLIGKKPTYNIVGFVAIDRQRDLILLKVNEARTPPLALTDSNNVAVGDEVYAVGNPQGLEGTFSKGIVSAVRKIDQDSLLQITAPISPGSSGGPILNTQGGVVGVAVATFKGGQNLNFAIPSSYLTALLGDMKPLKPLMEEKTAQTKTRSILSDLGGRSTEGIIGNKFLWNDFASIYGLYTFTLQNNLQEIVSNILCLVIFYDSTNQPIDVATINCRDFIPAKLAKRIKGSVDGSVWRLTTYKGEQKPHTKVEFRILDFEIVNANE